MAAMVALVAERLTSSPVATMAARAATGPDISEFVAPVGFDSMIPPARIPVGIDPFDAAATEQVEGPAAPLRAAPGVRASAVGGRQLTAIVVAGDRRVAVIDDDVVSVGDVLPDGARVTAIQPNRVFVVDSKGRWQTLTLTNRGQ